MSSRPEESRVGQRWGDVATAAPCCYVTPGRWRMIIISRGEMVAAVG